MGKPRKLRRMCASTLTSPRWEGPWTIGQSLKPDPRNSAVRHFRGASGNVTYGGNEIPLRNRKGEDGNPPPIEVGAFELYPNLRKAWPRGNWMALSRLEWTRFIGVTVCGRTTS
jgi:hypothetical protein